MLARKRRRRLLVPMVAASIQPWAHGQSCSVCRDGTPMPLPNQALDLGIDGFNVNTCSDLDSFTQATTAGNALCDMIQSMGSMCGCPIPPNACILCEGGGTIQMPKMELEGFPISTFFPSAQLPIASDTLLTCELMESGLHGYDDTDPTCTIARMSAAETCACQATDVGSNETVSSNSTSVPNIPTSPNATDESPGSPGQPESCGVCEAGAEMLYPEHNIPPLPKDVQGLLPPGVTKCKDLNLLADFLPKESSLCSDLQDLGSLVCGCDGQLQGRCTLCPHGEPCGMMDSLLRHPSSREVDGIGALCLASQLTSFGCGCSPDWKALLLTWGARVSGLLSLLMSCRLE